MGMANNYREPVKNPCCSILDRKKIFQAASVVYMGTPQCTLEAGHEGMHDGGWRIGQWSDDWSERIEDA